MIMYQQQWQSGMASRAGEKGKQLSLAAMAPEPAPANRPAAVSPKSRSNGSAAGVSLKVLRCKDGVRLDLDYADERGQPELMKALGVDDPVLCNGIVRDLAGLAASGRDVSEQVLNQNLAVVRGVSPTDSIEALLAVQMAAVHAASMKAAQRLKEAQTIDQQDSASSMFNKLMRTFTMQVEALKRHRSAGEQKVVVKHVHVYPGGQAVVGNVKASA